jgi:putative membrane protein
MKNSMSDTFFTRDDHEKIAAAIAAAEMTTAGEIVAMVVDRSDSYREAELLGSVLLAAILAVLAELILTAGAQYYATAGWGNGGSLEATLVLSAASLWRCIPLAVLLFFPVRLLFRRFERLKLPFVGRQRLAEAVRDRAVRAFYEKGLYKTRDETGILIFLSLLEHKVWILADRGINQRIAAEQWQGLAGELAQGMKAGRACAALCSVVGQCGVELARHFPRKADDRNELADGVLGH